MRKYQPRRASAKWLDADCPKGVLCIFDNPRYGDRYMVVYAATYGHRPNAPRGYLWGRGMSEFPSSPQGVGVSFEMEAHEVAALRYRRKHRYAKWSALPPAVKACVLCDLSAAD